MERVVVQWTETARAGLAKLPRKVRRGLLDQANDLRQASNPKEVHKPLTGPLAGYFRIAYARYRAIYTVDEERRPKNDTVIRFVIRFVAVAIRKEGDRKDYRLAQKLLDLGLIDPIGRGHPTDDDPKRKQR